MKKHLLVLVIAFSAIFHTYAEMTWFLNETFDSGEIPSAWTQEAISANQTSWVIESTASATFPATGNTSDYYVSLRNTTGQDLHYVTRLIAPAIDFAGADDVYRPRLIFKHAQVASSGDFDTLKVYYRVNENSPWTLLKVYDSRIDSWREDTVPLPNCDNAFAYQLAFESVENMGHGIVLDDIRVGNTPNCLPTSSVRAVEANAYDAILSWNGDFMADTFEVVLDTIEISNWNEYTPAFHGYAIDFQIVANGLIPSTTYYAYVRSKCEYIEEGWTPWAMGTFTTREVSGLPYIPYLATKPSSWVTGTDMTTVKPTFGTGNSYAVDTTGSLQFSAITAGKYAYAAMPQMETESIQGLEVSFWGTAASSNQTPGNKNIGRLYVGVMTNPDNYSTFEIVDSVEIPTANKHQYFTVPLADYAGRGNYIAFAAQNAERNVSFYVSNLKVWEPTVFTPTDVRVFNITPEGFDIEANLHNATAYNVRVARSADYKHKYAEMPSSFLFSQNNIAASSVCHVSGSYADSIVTVYVQGVNGSNQSEWAFPVTVRVPKYADVPLSYQFENEPKILLRTLDNELISKSTKKSFAGLYFTLVDFSSYSPDTTKDNTQPKYQGRHLLLQGTDRWFTLPYLESLESLSLSFYLAAPAIGQSRVAVGIMEDPYDLSTFTQLETFDGGAASYVKCELDLDDYQGNGHYVAIRAILPASPSSSYGGSINHIDDLRIDSVAPCREMRKPRVVFTSPTSATLSWNGKGMTKWQVLLFEGNPDAVPTSQDVTTASISFNNLTPLTTYYYQVNTLCGTDTVFGKTKYSFVAPTVLPFSENFESFAAGDFACPGWSNEHVSGTDLSVYKVDTLPVAKNSTHKLMLPKQTNGTITRLSLPAIYIPQADAYQFVLDVYRNGTGASYQQEGVRVMASDGNQEVELAFISRNISVADRAHDVPAEDDPGWYTYEFTIPFAGACKIILQGESKHGDAIYMDNLVINNASTCTRPEGVTVVSVGGNDAQLVVTPGAHETQWEYLCLKRGEDIDWSKATLAASPQITVTGLEPLTYYKVYLRAYCSSSEQSRFVTCNFTTECGRFSNFPWTEGFENCTAASYSSSQGQVPPCWSATSTGNTKPHVVDRNISTSYAYAHDGTKALCFYGSGTHTAVLPAFTVPLNTLKISFWYQASSTSTGMLRLGYFVANDTTFHTVATFAANTTMKQYEKVLTALPIKADQLAFRCAFSTTTACCIDDIRIVTVDPNCLGATDLRAAASSSTEAAVYWEAVGTQAVDVEVSATSNFSTILKQYTNETANPVTIDDLESEHVYYVRLRQSCDIYGDWLTTSFKTLCGAIAVADLGVQDFSGGATSVGCWELNHSFNGSSGTNSNPKVVSSTGYGQYLAFTKNANRYTKNDTTTYADGLYAIMPPLDVDSINRYEITFDAFATDNDVTNARKLTVGIITDPSDMATFKAIHSLALEYATDSTEAKNFTVRFTEYQGDYNDDFGKYIMFFAQTGDSANNVGIDNVEITTASACPRIPEGSVREIESDAVTYTWPTFGADSFDVVVLDTLCAPGTVAPVFAASVADTNAVRVTGLEAATIYYAYVRTICDESGSRWSARTRFRTGCGVKDLPLVETFDDIAQGIPVCWDNSEGTTTDEAYKWNYYKIANNEGCLRFESNNNPKGSTNVLATPAFNVEGNTLLTFKWKNPEGGKAEVWVAEVGDSVRTLLIDSAQLARVNNWTVMKAGLSAFDGKAVNVFFDGTSNYGTGDAYLYLDSVEIHSITGCYPLSSISALEVGRREMTLQLNPYPGFEVGNCELVYSESALSNAALEASEKITVDSSGVYTITGLDRETNYYVYARTNCGEDGYGEWVSSKIKTKGLVGCDNIMVGTEGTTKSSYLPLYNYYKYSYSQQIYTPSEIGGANRIPSIGFYNDGAEKTRDIEIYLKHTSKSEFATSSDWEDVAVSDKVFSGTVTFRAKEWTSIAFNTTFMYNGTDNLLLVVDDNTGSYTSSPHMSCLTFSGADNQAMYKYSDTDNYNPSSMASVSGTRVAAKNQLKLEYCYNIEACPTISDLSFEYLGDGTNSVVIRWIQAEADYFGGYDIVVSETAIPESVEPIPTYSRVMADSLVLNNLTQNTHYYVYIRTLCKADGHDEGVSGWANIDFETLAPCPAVINLQSELVGANEVMVSWSTILENQEKSFMYVVADTILDEAALSAATPEYVSDTTAVTISDLEYSHTYYIYVASVCDEENAPYRMTSITTDKSCPAIRDLVVERVAHNRVILSWKHSQFGSEEQYEAGIVGQEANAIIVADTTAMLVGLSPETQYTAYVKAVCSETESSELLLTEPFTTTLAPGNCTTLPGDTANSYLPTYSLYNYSLTEQIYTPSELGTNPRSIMALSFYNKGTEKTRTISIYLRHTSKTSFAGATDWESISASDLVYTGTVTFEVNQWVTLDLATPFAYNGTDNLLVAVDDNTGSWSSGLKCSAYATTDYQAMYVYSDGTNYDPLNASSYSGTRPKFKTQIEFCFSQEEGSCPSVIAMTVRDLNITSAVVAWEPMGSETEWNVQLSTEQVAAPVGTPTSSYMQFLEDLLPDTDYWMYVQPACGGEWKSIHFTTAALCPAPISLSVDSVAANSAFVSWTDEYSVGLSYLVAYGEAESFNPDSAVTYQTIQANANYAELTDLIPGTSYKFAVKADCVDDLSSRWSEPVTFKTACGEYELPWSDGFESGADCWTTGNVQSPNTSSYFASLVSDPQYVYSGQYSLLMMAYYNEGYSYDTWADSCYVILPEMDYGSLSLNQTTLSFYARNLEDAAYDCYDHVLVGVVSGTSIGTFELVQDVHVTGSYQQYDVPFSNYTGTGDRIAMIAVLDPNSWASTRYGAILADNMVLAKTSSCVRPTNVALQRLTDIEAVLTWEAGASETQWEYVCIPAGTRPDWSKATLADSAQAVVTGLTGNTGYDFCIRAYCSSAEQSFVTGFSFTTECATAQLPFTETFNSLTAGIPDCWNNDEGTTTNDAYKWNYYASGQQGACVRFNSGSNASGSTNVLATPNIYISDTAKLSFSWKNPDGGYAQVLIAAIGDSVRTPLTRTNLTGVNDWLTVECDLSAYIGDTVKIYFTATSNGGSTSTYIYLDNVLVETYDPSCAGVFDLQVTSVSLAGATLDWIYPGGHHDAEIQLATDANFSEMVDMIKVVNADTYVLTGLRPSSNYFVRVRQLCDGGHTSGWSNVLQFETGYGIPYAPVFDSSFPADWTRSNTTAAQVFAGTVMSATTSGWSVNTTTDNLFKTPHIRGNIYGTGWHYWAVTPAIDLSPNVGDGIILSFDADLTPYSSSASSPGFGGDDRFLVAVSTDGGKTWNPADVTEWNNTLTGDYSYNDVAGGKSYNINLSNYAGHVIKIGFYGESTQSNADNYFHFGNINIHLENAVTYVDSVCNGMGFEGNGFTISYDQLHEGLNAFSTYEVDSLGNSLLTIQQVYMFPLISQDLYVDLCEGEHYTGYNFDVVATTSQVIRQRFTGGSSFGCDSTVYLHLNVLPTVYDTVRASFPEGESYTWNGVTYYQSNIVRDTTSSLLTGCDSVTTLYLTKCPISEVAYHSAFCAGQSYSDQYFKNLTKAGKYDTIYVNELGCETKATIYLKELKPGEAYVDSVREEDLPYWFNGEEILSVTDKAGVEYHDAYDFGCGRVLITVYVVGGSGIDHVGAVNLQVAPNPVRVGEDIRILTDMNLTGDYSCQVYDAVGRLVYRSFEPAETIPGLPVAGMYSVRITCGTTTYQTKLLVR